MQVARREKGVDARTLGRLDRLVRRVDVLHQRTRKRGDRDVVHRLGDRLDGREIARRGDGEPRLENIHPQRLELTRHADLLFYVHRIPGSLLAIPKRRVKYSDLIHCISRF